MADVRTFSQKSKGTIAEAVAKAIGESVRPVTPGGSPDPSRTSGPAATSASVTATSFLVSDLFLTPEQPATSETPDEPQE